MHLPFARHIRFRDQTIMDNRQYRVFPFHTGKIFLDKTAALIRKLSITTAYIEQAYARPTP